jgi:hypothetical protein
LDDTTLNVYLAERSNPKLFLGKLANVRDSKKNQVMDLNLSWRKVSVYKDMKATIVVVGHNELDDYYQCTDVDIDESFFPTTNIDNPAPAHVQVLADELVSHLEVPFGCNFDKGSLPDDAPSKNLAALWLRAVFHDMGVIDLSNSTIPSSHGSLPFHLDKVSHSGIGESIATKFVARGNVSRADILSLTGQITVTHCGGPEIPFQFGRIDNPNAFDLGYRLPDDAHDSYETMIRKLKRLGWGTEDIVALVTGSHSLGYSILTLVEFTRRLVPTVQTRPLQPSMTPLECLTLTFLSNC